MKICFVVIVTVIGMRRKLAFVVWRVELGTANWKRNIHTLCNIVIDEPVFRLLVCHFYKTFSHGQHIAFYSLQTFLNLLLGPPEHQYAPLENNRHYNGHPRDRHLVSIIARFGVRINHPCTNWSCVCFFDFFVRYHSVPITSHCNCAAVIGHMCCSPLSSHTCACKLLLAEQQGPGRKEALSDTI